MILEVAVLEVIPGRELEFESAFKPVSDGWALHRRARRAVSGAGRQPDKDEARSARKSTGRR